MGKLSLMGKYWFVENEDVEWSKIPKTPRTPNIQLWFLFARKVTNMPFLAFNLQFTICRPKISAAVQKLQIRVPSELYLSHSSIIKQPNSSRRPDRSLRHISPSLPSLPQQNTPTDCSDHTIDHLQPSTAIKSHIHATHEVNWLKSKGQLRSFLSKT